MDAKTSPWSKVNRFFWWLATGAILIMGISTTMDVLWRWLTGEAIGPVYSLCETLMAVMVWSALSPTQEAGNHISVTILTGRLPDKAKTALKIFSLVVCLAFFALIFWKTLEDGLWAYGVKSYRYGDYYRFPAWWARLFVPVGVAGMMGQLVFEVIHNFKVLLGRAKNLPKGAPATEKEAM
ncbi:MAG: TRAP transporter small permease [Clostridia bacterium]|nr:TRAP transporter small permease [Clostridia bacterium]